MRKLGIYAKTPSKAKGRQTPRVPAARYPGERIQIDVKYVPTECMTKELRELGIKHSLIRPHAPTQNGKVERSHRTDQERFYYKNVFMSLKDLKEKGGE